MRKITGSWLLSAGLVAVLAVGAGMLAHRAVGGTDSRATVARTVTFLSGDDLLFSGSKLQCLGFGPAGVPDKSGVICSKGRPRKVGQPR